MSKQVLHRTVTTESEGESEVFHFASIDGGKNWLETTRAPTPDDYDGLCELFAGTIDPETGTKTGHITMTNRWFSIMIERGVVSEPRVVTN